MISDGFIHYKAFIRTPASPLSSPAPPQPRELQDVHQLSMSQPAALPPTLPPGLQGKTLVVMFQSISFSSPSVSSLMWDQGKGSVLLLLLLSSMVLGGNSNTHGAAVVITWMRAAGD